MTWERAIKEALRRARANGFDLDDSVTNGGYYVGIRNWSDEFRVKYHVFFGRRLFDRLKFPAEKVVFNHDFAKALWGERWQYHLRRMAVAISWQEYLAEYIRTEGA